MSISPRFLWTASLLLFLIPSAFAQAQNAEPPFTGITTGDNLNVRAGAGDNYYVVLQLERGSVVEVRDELFGWYQIVPPEGAYSYISKAFVNATGDGTTGVVNANRVRVRAPSPAGPSKSYRTQITLNDGDPVAIIDEADGYYRVKPPEGAFLFVSNEFVQPATDRQIAEARGVVPDDQPAPRPEPATDDEAAEDARTETVTETDAEMEAEAEDAQDDTEAEDGADEVDDASEQEPEPAPEPRPLVSEIAVLADGSIIYDGEAIAGDVLQAKLEAIAGEFERLTIQASREAPGRDVFGLLETARGAGIADIRFSSLPESLRTVEVVEDEADEEMTEAPEVAVEDDDAETEAEAGEEEVAAEAPLTFAELERRYAQFSAMPLREQPIGELRMDYEHLRVTGDLSGQQRRLADARIEILSMRHELQASLMEVSAVEEEAKQTSQRRAEEDAARPKQYAAVGRLTTSTLYTGEKLPLLYRVVDPTTGRTVAYVQPSPGVDPINLINKYVGVEGRRDFDGSLGLYVVTAKSIDELSATQSTRQR
ncbi:MAG: SH3 domain-containing protein [Phycisphaeraceae bacterium]